MSDTKMDPPVLVEEAAHLDHVCTQLGAQPRLAVDTESNSLYAYQEQVCLIQISTADRDYLIDTIKLHDLTPLAPLMADPALEKVLHAAEYDILCLTRDFDFRLHNLFDTRVPMRTLGRKKTGLGSVLEAEFGVKVNKRWQRANWGKRPLPAEMRHYARLDTHYLLALRDRLAKELRQQGRWEEAMEECLRLTQLEGSQNGFDPEGYWRISRARRLKPQQLAVLRQLYLMRDQYARHMDRPPFKVIGNKTLVEIAKNMPRSNQALQELHGMTKGQMRRYAEDILDAVDQGRKAEPPSPPRTDRKPDAVVNRYRDLRQWRKRKARQRRLESDLILPREIVWLIAEHAPRSKRQLQQLMQPLTWRFEAYGDEILRVVNS